MGKRKQGKKNAAALSQEEIWDDSALIQSWEDAVEEYKLYHSIQARGENVEDVLPETETGTSDAEAEVAASAAAEDEGDATQPQESVEQFGSVDATQKSQDGMAAGTRGQKVPQTATASFEADVNAATGPSNMPQAVLGGANASGRDEGLKNLMMAWYFAGYYSGLYEGQQLANQQ